MFLESYIAWFPKPRSRNNVFLCFAMTQTIYRGYAKPFCFVFLTFVFAGLKTRLGNHYRPSKHAQSNAQLYDAVMVVVSQKHGRKWRWTEFNNPKRTRGKYHLHLTFINLVNRLPKNKSYRSNVLLTYHNTYTRTHVL